MPIISLRLVLAIQHYLILHKQLRPPNPPCAVNCTTGRSPVDTPDAQQNKMFLKTIFYNGMSQPECGAVYPPHNSVTGICLIPPPAFQI